MSFLCNHGLPAECVNISSGAGVPSRRFYRCPNPPNSRCEFFQVQESPPAITPAPRPMPVPPLVPAPASHAPRAPGFIAASDTPQEETPVCRCVAPSVRRVVRKPGPNQNRPFFTCAKPKREQCGFFEWADKPTAVGQPSAQTPISNTPFPHSRQGKPPRPDAPFAWPKAVRPNEGGAIATSIGNGAVTATGMANGITPVTRPAPPHPDENPGKRPRAQPQVTRLNIALEDVQSVSVPLRLTVPQAVKDAVQKFSSAKTSKKKAIFGETRVTIPIEKVSEFDSYIRAHALVELDYDVPRVVLDRLGQYHKNEVAREEAGDVVTRSLDEMLPTRLCESLMQFQWHGVHFALKHGGRCIIGDDMGLGKTIQAIAIARVYMEDWPLLIVCPSSLRLNWKEELLNWLGGDVVEEDIRVIMTGKDVTKVLRRINIMSYDLVRKVPSDVLKRCQFIIADESHYLKSVAAQRTKIVTPLVKTAKRALLLSGTPALSRPVELFTQVNAIAPTLFPSYNDYVVRYCNAHQSYWGYDVSGSSNLEELHTIMTGTVLIRRKKEEVLTQLPEKVRQVMWVETKASVMKSISRKFVQFEEAKAAASEAATAEDANVLITRVKGIQNELYALSAEAKMQSILEFCKDTAESGVKFIVFAHHAKMVDALDNFVQQKLKLGLIRIDGNTPQTIRQALCKKFQSDDDSCRVALLSITAAGVGLTLTKATVVLFAELYWNPGTLLQAEDRAHRIGQRNSILVNYLLAKATLDESMWKTVRRKLTVVGQSLTGIAGRMEVEEGKKNNESSAQTSKPEGKDIGTFFVCKKKDNQQEADEDSQASRGVDEKGSMPSPITDLDGPSHTTGTSLERDVKKKDASADKTTTGLDEMFAIDVDDEADQNKGISLGQSAFHNGQISRHGSYIDADLALARRLQDQFDSELH